MTVSSIVPVNTYTGNSSVKKFDFDFLIEDEKELVVQHISENGVTTTLTLGVDYSINEVGNQNGSYIIFPLESSSYNILNENEKITLMLTLTIKQESEFKNSSYFNLNILEWTFDYIVRILQILSRKIERCVKVGEGLSVSPDEVFEELNESKRIALNAAESAYQAQQIAEKNKEDSIQYLEDFNQKVIDFNELYQDCFQSIVDRGIETRANVDLSNLSETGEKHFLNKSQITNCVLEVPNRIKYTFEDGTLTIKAGSILSYPNGAGVFEDITLNKDLSLSSVGSGSDDIFIIYKVTSGVLSFGSVSTAIVGTTAPTGTAFYYDTTNNKISFYSEGVLHSTDYTFPLLIASRTSGVMTSINQVFNGVGYIGNRNFLLPKTKMLIAHGYNDDGTYKNIEYVNDSVMVALNNFTNNSIMFFRKHPVGDRLQIYNIPSSQYLGELDHVPVLNETKFQWYYNTLERLWYQHEINETSWTQADYLNITKCTTSSVEPIEAFSAVNFFDIKDNLVVIDSYSDGVDWYRVWSDGWCEQGGYIEANNHHTNTAVTLLKAYANTNYNAQLTGTESVNSGDNGSWNILDGTSKTIASFYAYNSSDNSSNFYWETKGYVS